MAQPNGGLTRLDLAASTALAAFALLAYQLGPTPVAVLALVVFAVVAYRAPTAGVVAVVLALPYYGDARPTIRGLAFSAAEVGTVLTTLVALPRLLAQAWAEIRRIQRIGLGGWLAEGWSGWGWVAAGGVILVLLGFISLAASVQLAESLRSLRTIVAEPVALLFVALFAPERGSSRVGRERAAWLAGAVVASAVGTSAFALWQLATGSDWVVSAEGVLRVRGLYGSPNNLALFIGRGLPVAACVFAFGRGVWRWAAGLAFLLITVVVFLTYSVGAWVALPIALLVVAAIRGRRILIAYVGAGVVLALASLPFLLQIQRFSSHLAITGGTNVFRLAVWSAALAMIRDHPIFGIGLDNFLHYYHDLGYMPPSGAGDPLLSHPHNIFLDFWLSLSILGLVLAVVLLWRFFARALQVYREAAKGGDWTAPIVLGIIGGMADVLLHGLIDNAYFLPDLSAVFWIIFAILSLAGGSRGGQPNRYSEESTPRPKVEEARS